MYRLAFTLVVYTQINVCPNLGPVSRRFSNFGTMEKQPEFSIIFCPITQLSLKAYWNVLATSASRSVSAIQPMVSLIDKFASADV